MAEKHTPACGKTLCPPSAYRILSIPVSMLAILIVYYFKIPNPMMILIIPIVFFAYAEGYFSASLSGATAIAYSYHFFFIATADKVAGQKVLTIALAVSVIVILVGKLKARDDRIMAELEQARKASFEAKERAEELNRTKSDFLSRMSHEIRTPMNAVIGMTAIARKSQDIERIRTCLARIDDASTHLLGVINEVLDMSKIEAGKLELSPTDFVLEYMLGRVLNLNKFRFEQKEQDFSIYVDDTAPVAIIADEQHLAQVLANLLSNATKFTPHEGKISLSVHVEEETADSAVLRFEVRDQGIGMTEEQQSRLFQSYQQADGTITRRFGGTGLGLAISKKIVEMMGGTIWVESKPGAGSRFLFRVPVKKGIAGRSTHLSPNVDWKTIRLLVVDESSDELQYFKSITDSLHLACDISSSADEALRRLHENDYQIVFIGLRMAETDGISLAAKIRAENGGQVLVLMSARDWAPIEREARGAGIEYFIGKPLLPSLIIDCVNQCLGEKSLRVTQLEPAAETGEGVFLGKRVLLVEDVAINREIIKAMLEETGIEITEADNGQVGCDLFNQDPGKYDIILMDIHMPVMDGYAMTKCIRESPPSPEAGSVPILAMTANVFREDIERCLACGMNDHIGKPVNAEELLRKMKRLVPAR